MIVETDEIVYADAKDGTSLRSECVEQELGEVGSFHAISRFAYVGVEGRVSHPLRSPISDSRNKLKSAEEGSALVRDCWATIC